MKAKKIRLHAVQNPITENFEHISEDIERLQKLEVKPNVDGWFEKQ